MEIKDVKDFLDLIQKVVEEETNKYDELLQFDEMYVLSDDGVLRIYFDEGIYRASFVDTVPYTYKGNVSDLIQKEVEDITEE